MKKILLLAMTLLASQIYAQDKAITFGIKAGANFSNLNFDVEGFGLSPDGKTSVFIGVLMDVGVAEKLHFQPELQYSMEGADSIEGQDLGLDFFNIPLMLKYYIVEGFNIQAGPQIGFIINEGDFDGIKSTNFVLNFGAGYELPIGLFFDARYNLGLSNIAEDDPEFGDISLKTKGFQLGIGYRF